MTQSRTDQALVLLRTFPELTPYQAAKEAGIHPTTLYKALKRARIAQERPKCPTCGQTMPIAK